MVDSFDLEDFDEIEISKNQNKSSWGSNIGSKNQNSKLDTNTVPQKINYEKKFNELGQYNFSIEEGSDISDIIVYLEKLQINRSRIVELEQEADKNHSSIKMTYEILFATELLQRPEKTAKEKEAAALVKLKEWAKTEEDAKVYANACARFLKQIDTTHHLLTKILNAKQLEVQLRAYESRSKESLLKPFSDDISKWVD